MDIQELIDSLKIFLEFDSGFAIQFLEDEIRITLQSGVRIGEEEVILLDAYNWQFSEGDWVRWL